MDKQKLAQYAALKTQIKTLEKELDLLKEPVMEMLGDNDEIQTDFGTFTKVNKRKYSYPSEIAIMEDIVKEKKKEAEATGTATYTENPYILFKEVKGE